MWLRCSLLLEHVSSATRSMTTTNVLVLKVLQILLGLMGLFISERECKPSSFFFLRYMYLAVWESQLVWPGNWAHGSKTALQETVDHRGFKGRGYEDRHAWV